MRVPPRILIVLAVLVGGLAVAAPPASASDGPPRTFIVAGRGNGHGRGMSQYGAFGWATVHGATWDQILGFYFGGSTGFGIGPLADPGQQMSIHLAAMNEAQTAIVADAGNALFAADPTPGRTWVSLVAREISQRVYRVWGSTERRCPGAGAPESEGFVPIADVAEAAIFTTTTSNDPNASPDTQIGLCEPRANGRNKIRYYRGEIRAVNNARNENRTINVLPIEEYLRGVVPRESPASWGNAAGGAGMHALRAQAVAARSYSSTENRYAGLARTCDTQSCQVYGGAMLREALNTAPIMLEHPLTDQAIRETAGIVIVRPNGTPVRTEYSSSNGGRTAGGTFPAQGDPGDLASAGANPNLIWSRLVTREQIAARFPQVGTPTAVTTEHDGLGGEFNGYTTAVTISGTGGNVRMTGWDFRRAFDLPAPWFGVAAASGAALDAPPVGTMLYIGDSVGESITAEFDAIVRPAYPQTNFQARTNRCMVGPSCISAAGVAPDALSVIASLAPDQYPGFAVVQLGYNDDPNSLGGKIDQVLGALNARGVGRVVFVNLSTRRAGANYETSNALLAQAAAVHGNVSLLDWNGWSSAPERAGWFRDGVHLTASGRVEFARFLRAELDRLRAEGVIAVGPAPVVPLASPMSLGNRGDNVRTLQTALNRYLGGSRRIGVDGVMGPGTVRAVRLAEQRAGLPVDGIADDALLAAIGVNPNRLALRPGTRHPNVTAAQQALARALGTRIVADGIYGNGTRDAVRRFQRQAGLKQTGVINRPTWLALLAASAQR